MYKVIFDIEDGLVYPCSSITNKEYIAEHQKQMKYLESVFQFMETTLPCVPTKGMMIDLTEFVNMDSLSDWEAMVIQNEWSAVISTVFVGKDSFRCMICSYQYYKEVYENKQS